MNKIASELIKIAKCLMSFEIEKPAERKVIDWVGKEADSKKTRAILKFLERTGNTTTDLAPVMRKSLKHIKSMSKKYLDYYKERLETMPQSTAEALKREPDAKEGLEESDKKLKEYINDKIKKWEEVEKDTEGFGRGKGYLEMTQLLGKIANLILELN
jgi:uncharacterized damage-inducible protein DinB